MSETEFQEETEISVSWPGQYKVVLHNDNYTTVDFVVDLLIQLFAKSEMEAFQVTQHVHDKGRGVAGVYQKEIAEQKVAEAMVHANRNGFPLILTAEPE